jgi:hypothetical protein
VGSHKLEPGSSPLVRIAFSIPVFCFRNNISRPTYHRLRAEGRGPVEMRIGLNIIRISAQAEADWQRQMQEPREDLETLNAERAVKAGTAAAKSDRHISKTRKSASEHPRASRQPSNSQPPKEVADQQRTIRELSARVRKARKLSKRSEQPQPDDVGTDGT